jgi:hypothetical protein
MPKNHWSSASKPIGQKITLEKYKGVSTYKWVKKSKLEHIVNQGKL